MSERKLTLRTTVSGCATKPSSIFATASSIGASSCCAPTAAGVSAVFAVEDRQRRCGSRPASERSRWAKQAGCHRHHHQGVPSPRRRQVLGRHEDRSSKRPTPTLPSIRPSSTGPTMDAELTAGTPGQASRRRLSGRSGARQVRQCRPGRRYHRHGQRSDAAPPRRQAIAPFTWDVTNFDGKTYGVGALGAAFGIFYNVDLLEAAGITEFPKTRDALVEAGEGADHGSGLGLPVPRLVPRLRTLGLAAVRPQRRRRRHDADLTAQNLDPKAAAATQYLADMKLVHKVSPEAGAYDWADQQGRSSRPAASPSCTTSTRRQCLGGRQARSPFALASRRRRPRPTVASRPRWATSAMPPSPRRARVKEAAWEFVKWWTSADVINPYAAKIGLQTVRTDSSPPYRGNC